MDTEENLLYSTCRWICNLYAYIWLATRLGDLEIGISRLQELEYLFFISRVTHFFFNKSVADQLQINQNYLKIFTFTENFIEHYYITTIGMACQLKSNSGTLYIYYGFW